MTKSKLFTILGADIKKARLWRRMTQEQLAEKSKMKPDFIDRLEQGQVRVTIEGLTRIAAALRVKMGYILRNI